MSRITITENGVETIVTDIAPYRARRDGVLATLTLIYADFENVPAGTLDTREAEIVVLVNRYHDLTHTIDRFDEAAIRRANITAGWEIVKQHRVEESK
jgi:hypothetical protein